MQSVSDEDASTSTSSVSTIWSRLSEELRKNLFQKLNIYLSRDDEATHAALIFTDNADLWTTEEDPVIVTSEPLPPIPADYDHENFDIEKDVHEYVKKLAKLVTGDSPLYVSSVTFGKKDRSLQMHLVFSQHDKSAQSYLKDAEDYNPETSTSASVSSNMIPAQYRFYSSSSVNLQDYKKIDLMIKRILDDERTSSMSDESSSADSVEELSRSEWTTRTSSTSDDEVRRVQRRLGYMLGRNLDRKIEIYANRRVEAKYNPVIFTNDESLWRTNKEPLIVIDPMPPMPPSYNYGRFDICNDMIVYMRDTAKRSGIEEKFHISLLQFGPRHRTHVHFLLSQYVEHMEIYCKYFDLLPTEFLPSDAWSAPAAEGVGVGPSQPKRQRRSSAKSVPLEMARDDSLEEIEELPTDTVPIDAETSL